MRWDKGRLARLRSKQDGTSIEKRVALTLQKPFDTPAAITNQAKRRRLRPIHRHAPGKRHQELRSASMEVLVAANGAFEDLTFDFDARGIRFQHTHEGEPGGEGKRADQLRRWAAKVFTVDSWSEALMEREGKLRV